MFTLQSLRNATLLARLGCHDAERSAAARTVTTEGLLSY